MEYNLNIKQGDSIFVHCGFGFLNADFSPSELIATLKDIIGKDGHIAMPFYPPGLSRDWLKSKRTFDFETTRCSTGVLSQQFSQLEGVEISHHPIKSIAVFGPKAKFITEGHNCCKYPYDKDSPYYKFASLDKAKSIGLGVSNCTLIHMIEDIFEQDKCYLYSKSTLLGSTKNNGTLHNIRSFYHHGNEKLISSKEFFLMHCSDIYNHHAFNNIEFYSIKTHDLLEKGQALFTSGYNRRKNHN
ncbi:AAC(3) family N-acetyltransferase [Vibrio alfacsensis]|uniref:AAC(3) family N-acetyltransferase n=1 Tax=Vibrio TaxID=662 RepID=UPI00406869CD